MSKTNNAKTKKEKEQRELETLAEILVILTKEYMENNELLGEADEEDGVVKTKSIKGKKGQVGTLGVMVNVVFRHAYRAVEFLAQTKPLASVEAYKEFKKETGEDIRKYNWFGRAKIAGKSKEIHKEYQWEHMTTAKKFKDDLRALYEKNQLTKENIITLINKQEICWVTKEENDRLNEERYSQNRPAGAYNEPKINIKIQKP